MKGRRREEQGGERRKGREGEEKRGGEGIEGPQGNIVGTLSLEGHNSIQMKSQFQMLEKPLGTWTDFIYYIIPSKPHTKNPITHKNQLHFRDNCHLETAPMSPLHFQ